MHVADIDKLVHIDKLQLLYKQSLQSVFALMMAGAIWAGMMWPVANPKHLKSWIVTVIVVSSLRAALFFAYLYQKPQGDDLLRWWVPYLITLSLAVPVWGIGTAIVTPHDSLVHMCMTYAFLIGLGGAALPAYGVFTRLAVGVTVVLLVPIVVLLLLRGETQTTILAAAGLWFFLTSIRAIYVHNASITRSFRLAHELRHATRIAEFLANTDGLTGLNNRRAYTSTASAILDLALREKRASTMLIIDVDQFKQINDQHGHQIGDAALVLVAETLTQELRTSDVCGRLGGDEFAVLLPNTSQTAAVEVAQKIIDHLLAKTIETPTTSVSVSLSIGIAHGLTSFETLLNRADTAMYEAKRAGRGRIVVAATAAE